MLSGTLIGCGMSALVFFQTFINISVTTGLDSQYGYHTPVCKLWSDFAGQLLYWNRTGTECRTSDPQILILQYYLLKEAKRMNVAFVAHDSKEKADAESLHCVSEHILAKHTLYATGTTGRLIEEVTNLNIHKFLCRTCRRRGTAWSDD